MRKAEYAAPFWNLLRKETPLKKTADTIFLNVKCVKWDALNNSISNGGRVSRGEKILPGKDGLRGRKWKIEGPKPEMGFERRELFLKDIKLVFIRLVAVAGE